MSIATIDQVIEFDEDGQIDGLQFDSRERAIQEWRDRKEEQEYAALFQRLQKRNSARRSRASAEGLARIRENERRYKSANRSRIRAMERARRKARYDADPVVNQCEECGAAWSPPYEQRVKKSRFCSRSCRNRAHGRTRSRGTGQRNMSIKRDTLAYLRANPLSTAEEIAQGIGAKPRSLRVCLTRWLAAGLIQRTARRNGRYSIADTRSE